MGTREGERGIAMKVQTMQKVMLVLFVLVVSIVQSYAESELWRRTYDSSIGAPPNLYPAEDIGRQIGFDASGNIYVLASSLPIGSGYSANPWDCVILKYDPDGNKLWHRIIGSQSEPSPSSFHVDPRRVMCMVYMTANILI